MPINTKYKPLKIALWNANTLSNKVGEVISFLTQYKIDILIITETKLTANYKLKIRNYQIHRKDRTLRGGGVAILIKHTIPHSVLNTINTQIEQISIKLRNGVVISGCYAKPRLSINNNDFDVIFNQSRQVLALGDFNARHTAWRNHVNNRNGHFLHDYAIANNIQVLETPQPSHHPSNNTRPTFIDLVLNKNILNLPDPLILDKLPSDHLPLLLNWNVNVEKEQAPTTYVF